MANNQDNSKMFRTTTGINTNNNLKEWTSGNRPVKKERRKLLGGKSIGTTIGGRLSPVMFKVVNAGEKIVSWKCNQTIRILSPKVPTTDAITGTLRAGFIPMTWLVNNYDELKANKKSIDRRLLQKLPTVLINKSSTQWGNYQDTYAWRNKTLSFYTPNRVNPNIPVSVLPARAYHEFRNAFCRNKEYQPMNARFTEQVVTQTEKDLLCGTFDPTTGAPILTNEDSGYGTLQKDTKKNNYYTDIKLSLQERDFSTQMVNTNGLSNYTPDNMSTGISVTIPTQQDGSTTTTNTVAAQQKDFKNLVYGAGVQSNQGMENQGANSVNSGNTNNLGVLQIDHIEWQNQIAEYRRRTNDSVLNDWEIIAKLGGVKPIVTDRPMYLGDKIVKLNYQQITQTAPATTESTSTALGFTGSYSVTTDESILFGMQEFLQDGIIIVTLTIQADFSSEEAIHRTALIQGTTDMFNPELAKQQIDYLLPAEIEASKQGASAVIGKPLAFKKKYSEFDTMPNLCIGQMRTINLKTNAAGTTFIPTMNQWHNFKTFGNDENISLVNNDFFKDTTEDLIARNSIFTRDKTAPDVADQILFAIDHDVEVWKQAKLSEINGWGQEI